MPSRVCAESLCSDRAIIEISQAIELFDRKEFQDSTNDLCGRIKAEPQCAEAWWVQSFIDFCLTERQGQAPLVVRPPELRKRALEINPNLAESWQQSDLINNPDLRTQTFEHFEVRYFRPEDRDLAWDVNGYLNEICTEVGSAFGAFPHQRFLVMVYTPEAIVQNWRTISLGGFFNLADGILRIRAGGDKDPELGVQRLARREYFRAYWSTLHLKGIPGWMREGSADFYAHQDSGDGYWKDNRLEAIRLHFRSDNSQYPITLKKMEDYYLNKKIVTTLGKYDSYLQAEAMVLEIAKERGDSWIPQVVQRMQNGENWQAAYDEVVGVPPETVLERFRKSWEPTSIR